MPLFHYNSAISTQVLSRLGKQLFQVCALQNWHQEQNLYLLERQVANMDITKTRPPPQTQYEWKTLDPCEYSDHGPTSRLTTHSIQKHEARGKRNIYTGNGRACYGLYMRKKAFSPAGASANFFPYFGECFVETLFLVLGIWTTIVPEEP